jgi:uncharacterized protein YjbI with pentapeptide repeats
MSIASALDTQEAPNTEADLRLFEIHDRLGRILYRGYGESKKDYVQSLARRGMSFAGADLCGVELNSANLSGADFSGADLTGASFKGAQLSRAIFDNAILENTGFFGANLTSVRMRASCLDGTSFHGATMTNADLTGVKAQKARFDDVRGANIVLRCSALAATSFADARMSRIDLRGSNVAECDFSRADFRSSAQREGRIDILKQDLTAHAFVIGCKWDQAKIGDAHPKLLGDRRTGKVSEYGVLLTSALAIGIGVNTGIEALGQAVDLAGAVGSVLQNSSFGIGIVTAAALAREVAIDELKNHFEKLLRKTHLVAEATAQKIGVLARRKKDAVFAFTTPENAITLTRALRDADPEHFSGKGRIDAWTQAIRMPGLSVIVADKRNIDLALSHLILNREIGAKRGQDVVIYAADGPDESGRPCARVMRFGSDGTTVSIRYCGGTLVRMCVYDPAGRIDLVRSSSIEPFDLETSPSRRQEIRDFEKTLLARRGLTLEFPEATHDFDIAKDGTIFVFNQATRQLGNPAGPAIVRADGTALSKKAARQLLRDSAEEAPPTDTASPKP